MLKKGIPGTDQLSTTRRLADSVPPLALAYLSKLVAGAAPAAAAPRLRHRSPPHPRRRRRRRPCPAALDAPSTLPAWKVFSQ